MPRFRFSLLALFGFVTAMAIACAAIARPTELWEIAISAGTLALLAFAVLAAVYGRQAGRAFWMGFAMVGWSYLGAQHFDHAKELPTTRITQMLRPFVHPQKFVIPGPGKKKLANRSEIQSFGPILWWLWPAFLGFVAGVTARSLYLRLERALPKN